MTLVHIDLQRRANGANNQGVGILSFRPTGRQAEGAAVVLPAPFQVEYKGVPVDVELAELPVGLAWLVIEDVANLRVQRCVRPTGATANYSALEDLDPATFDSARIPAAAWWAEVETQIDDASLVGDDLVLSRRNGSTVNVGSVRGPNGIADDVSMTAILNNSSSAFAGAVAAKLVPVSSTTAVVDGALTINKHNPIDATAGNITMSLANATAAGQLVSVEKTDGGTNTITISGKIRGSAGTISLAYQRETLLFSSQADGSWWPVSGHRTKSSIELQVNTITQTVSAIAGESPAATTTRLNAALSQGLALGVKRHIIFVGAFVLGSALIVPSDTTIDDTRASFTLSSSANSDNLLRNASATPVQTITGVSMASGSSTITGTGFTSALNGKRVGVVGAGVTGGLPTPSTCDLFGIVTYVSATELTITPIVSATTASVITAKQAVSNVAMKVYDVDRDIAIIGGGIWDRGTPQLLPDGNHNHLWLMRHVIGFRVVGKPRFKSTQSKYAIALGDVHGWDINAAVFDTASDGVHVTGPSSAGHVGLLTGITRDDQFSITATDYGYFGDVSGDVVGIRVDQLHQSDGATQLKIISGTGTAVAGVDVGLISGTTTGRAVAIGDDATGATDVDVRVRRLTTRVLSDTAPLVELAASLGKTITFDDIDLQVGNARTSGNALIRILAAIQLVKIGRVTSSSPGTGAWTALSVGIATGTMGHLEIGEWNYKTNNDAHVPINLHAGWGTVSIRGAKIERLSRMIYQDAAGLLRLFTSDVQLINAGNGMIDTAGSLDWSYSNVYIDAYNAYLRTRAQSPTANSITIRGRGISGLRSGVGTPVGSGLSLSGQTGALTLKCKAPDFPLGVAQAGVGKTMGDEAYNVDATLTPSSGTGAQFVGPVISDGNVWKHKFSGATV